MPTTIAEAPALQAADRCDRCGARATVRVVFAGGGELLFCRHHARQHERPLREAAVEYVESDPAYKD